MADVDIHDLLAYDGLKIIQGRDLFRFSLDSLLLANFVNINLRAKKIIDLGCGNAPIPLFLTLKTDKKIIGIDVQKEACELARKSISLNKLDDQIEIFNADINDVHNLFQPSSFDIVISNPPFFKFHEGSLLNKYETKSISRHEVLIDLEGIIRSVSRIITTGGSFNLIHRANRLEEIIVLLNKYSFAIKRMQFVYTSHNKDALMVLIDARANGNNGDIKVLKPLYVYNKSNEYTDEILDIFHFGDDLYEKKS